MYNLYRFIVFVILAVIAISQYPQFKSGLVQIGNDLTTGFESVVGDRRDPPQKVEQR